MTTVLDGGRSRRGLLPWVVVAGGVLAFLLRGLPRLVHPQLCAEDGTIFLAGAYNEGLPAVFQPYNGYLHLIPRVIAAFWVHLPLAAVPYAYAVSAVTVYLLSSALVLSWRVSWLIPSKFGRTVAFVLLCLLPPMQEVYGNIANLVAVCGLALFLFAMSDDPCTRAGRVMELCAISVVALTGPFSIFLFPLFAYRWFRNGRSFHSLAAGAAVGIGACVQAICVLGSTRERAPGHGPVVFAQGIVERFAGEWLFGPVNPFPTHTVFAYTVALLWLAGAVAVTVAALRRAGLAMWLIVSFLCASATWAYGAEFQHWGWVERAVMVPTAIVMVALIATVARRNFLLRRIALLCLMAGLASFLGSFAVAGYPQVTNINALAKCLHEDARRCVAPEYPLGWTVVLQSGH